jgi:hypothetical protein
MSMAYLLWQPRLASDVKLTIVIFSTGLFVSSMFCHGELVRPST